jgi:hypothetical protein
MLLMMGVILPLANALASQSSVEQKTSYNSDKQLTFSLGGTWGFDERAYGTASFSHSRTPLDNPAADIDTFYQGLFGVGYAINNLGFDVGATMSQSPLTQSSGLGGYIGFSYIFTDEFTNPAVHTQQALDLLHTQIYERNPEHPPIFWVRLGFAANTLRTKELGDQAPSGKQTSVTFDFHYSPDDNLFLTLSTAFYTNDDSTGFFTNAERNADNFHTALLGATLQGLPHTSLGLQATWQIAPRDSLVPRYQATEVDSTRQWSHTIDLGWRHHFLKEWFISPTYEATIQGDTAITGLIFAITYLVK